MAKTWILDTDTKGTGAQMVPLEETKERPQRRTAPDVVAPERPRKETAAPGPSRTRGHDRRRSDASAIAGGT
jgi:hypothetical protein